MLLPSFFNLYKNRQFTYKPIFYDKAKDDLKERIKKVEDSLSGTIKSEYRIGITRGSIRRYSKLKAKTKKRSNLRLILIIFILLAIAWYFLYK